VEIRDRNAVEYRVNIALTLSYDGTFLILYNTI